MAGVDFSSKISSQSLGMGAGSVRGFVCVEEGGRREGGREDRGREERRKRERERSWGINMSAMFVAKVRGTYSDSCCQQQGAVNGRERAEAQPQIFV